LWDSLDSYGISSGTAKGRSGNAGAAAADAAFRDDSVDVRGADHIYPPSYPAEIVLSQQMQLIAMQEKIQSLQDLVRKLGGEIPVSSSESPDYSALSPPVPVPAAESVGLYTNIPPKPKPASPVIRNNNASPAQQSVVKNDAQDEEELQFRARDDDIPMRLIRADSPVMGHANKALDKGRAGEKDVYNSSTTQQEKTTSKGQTQNQAVKSISHPYNRANPLASSSENHPVIRVHGDEESELMEPSIFKTPRFGDAPFPGASLDNDDEAGEFVDDYDSDEDRLRNLKYDQKLDYGWGHSGNGIAGSLSGVSSSTNSGTSSLRTSLSSIGGGGGYGASSTIEAATLLESDSILAIEAKYRL
jgi:hypothetical protein